MHITPARSAAILSLLLAGCQGLATSPSSTPAPAAQRTAPLASTIIPPSTLPPPATGGLEIQGGAGTVKVDENGTVTIKANTAIPTTPSIVTPMPTTALPSEDSGDTND